MFVVAIFILLAEENLQFFKFLIRKILIRYKFLLDVLRLSIIYCDYSFSTEFILFVRLVGIDARIRLVRHKIGKSGLLKTEKNSIL